MSIKIVVVNSLPSLESAIRKDFPNYSLETGEPSMIGGSSEVRKVFDENKNIVAVLKMPNRWGSPLQQLKQSFEARIKHIRDDEKLSKDLEGTHRVAKVLSVYPIQVQLDKELISDADIIRDIASEFTSQRWGEKIPSKEVIIDDLINMLKGLRELLDRSYDGLVILKEFIEGPTIKEAKKKKIITKKEFINEFIELLRILESYGIAWMDNMPANCIVDVRDSNKIKIIETGGCALLDSLARDKESLYNQIIKNVIYNYYESLWGELPSDETIKRAKKVYVHG